MIRLSSERSEWKVTAEPGGWCLVRRKVPRLAPLPALPLLASTARLSGNLRYALDGRRVACCGDFPLSFDEEPAALAESRLMAWLEDEDRTEPAPEHAALGAALEEAGLTVTEREGAWVAPLAAAAPREAHVVGIPGGARVETQVIDVAALDGQAREALPLFLLRANGAIRFARCETNGERLVIASTVVGPRALEELPRAVEAVAAACRNLLREALLLATPPGAGAYLQFHRDGEAAYQKFKEKYGIAGRRS